MIAVDGKSLKDAYEKGEKSSPRMMVSAYAAGLRLTLATVAAKDRNEVDAALEVIGLIDLKGKIVTGGALHCNRRRMVEAIVEKGGDYCIALKGNQESLLLDARAWLAKANEPKAKKQHPVAKTEASGHGRVRRHCWKRLVLKRQIENGVHWQLDVSFGEDAARNRKDNGPANIAFIRRRALDVARLDQSKGSLTGKLKRVGWNDEPNAIALPSERAFPAG